MARTIVTLLLIAVAGLLHVSFSEASSLLVFIGITSAPDHRELRQSVRRTWLKPCIDSHLCSYRFFIDVPTAYMSQALLAENRTFNDMAFRSSCSLMRRHPDTVNYGNTMLHAENMVFSTIVDGKNVTLPNPDYPTRRLYKVDWKVCFMLWALAHHRSIAYHVFVEDDSFMCTNNLLHQCRLLEEVARRAPFPPFRTGAPTFMNNGDSFDDSSTFMSGAIAEAFAYNYRRPAMDCSGQTSTLSWGTSWRPSRCNWREVLRTHDRIRLNISLPLTNCSQFAREGDTSRYGTCPEHPLILHHKFGGEFILGLYPVGSAGLSHLCENMLLLDKVKDTQHMQQLWEGATSTSFRDFSSVFTNDGTTGWGEWLRSNK